MTMRNFVLQRDEDVTGVSGTGVVAEGVVFSDGRVAVRWLVGEHRSTVVWDNLSAVVAIHGHDGRTQVVFDEGDGNGDAYRSSVTGRYVSEEFAEKHPRTTVHEGD